MTVTRYYKKRNFSFSEKSFYQGYLDISWYFEKYTLFSAYQSRFSFPVLNTNFDISGNTMLVAVFVLALALSVSAQYGQQASLQLRFAKEVAFSDARA